MLYYRKTVSDCISMKKMNYNSTIVFDKSVMNLCEKDKKATLKLLEKPLHTCSMFTVSGKHSYHFPINCDKAKQELDHMLQAKYAGYNVTVNTNEGSIIGGNRYEFIVNEYDHFGYTVYYPK